MKHPAIITAEQMVKNEQLKKDIIEKIQDYQGDLHDIVVMFIGNKFEVDAYWKMSYKDFRKVLVAVDRGLVL